MKLNYKNNLVEVRRWVPPTKRENYLKLDLNENYSLIDKSLLKDLIKINNFLISCYPEYDNLLSLLSKYTNNKIENIVLTNGADQAIDLILRLFFDKKSRVVMPTPVFSIYDHIFSILGTKVEHIPYKLMDNDFIFPIDEVLKSLDKKNGIILCNPNNPLGSPIDDDCLEKIIKKTYKLNIPCVIDEAYFEFYGKTSIDLVKKYPNLIIIRTFSKVFALAGLRLGYIVANKDINEQLLKLRGPWDVNGFSVSSAEKFLEKKEIFLKKIDETKKIRNDLIVFLQSLNLKVYKSVTNFVTVKFKDSKKVNDFLKQNGILVNNLTGYPFDNHLLDECIRITIPNKKGFIKLKSIFSKFRE